MRAVMVAALMVGVAAVANPHALAGAPGGAGSGKARPGSGVDAAYLARGGNGTDWPSVGGGSDERRFSPLDAINAGNVASLGIAWWADLPDARGQEATPVMVDGVLYLTGPWSKVFAYDARTGRLLWTHDPKVPGETAVRACCDVVNRGVAVWKGRVFVGALDGRLIALDSATGRQLWSVQTTDPARPYTITGAPRIVKDMVVIGNGGAEFGVRGYVTAYDAATGAKKWRFYTVPNPDGRPDGEASDAALGTHAAATWSAGGQWRQSGGGGTVWDAIVYDAALDQLYIGVGNGNPWNHGLRSAGEGDNLFLSSIVALRPDSGEYLWHYQETPGETWDYTATQPIILAELDGRPVLYHAPKNGFFFVLDRRSGRPLSADMFTKVNWATGYDPATWRPVEAPEARFYRTGKPFLAVPAPIGAHSWQPMSFSPATGLVYLPVNDIAFGYLPPLLPGDDQPRPLGFNTGTNLTEGGLPRDPVLVKAAIAATRGALVAWDPAARRARWRVDYPTPWNGGTLATAGNLVFQGTALGELRAYAADSGRQLWSLPTRSGVMAAPATYTLDGTQYVAFTTGRGGAWPLTAGAAGGAANQVPSIPRLIVLKLGGKARLPAAETVELPFDPPVQTASAETVLAGKRLFARYCSVCHGSGAVGGGVTPDLRRSGLLGDAAAWASVVRDGALTERGMVSFRAVVDAAGAEALRAYVTGEAHYARSQQQAAGAGGSAGTR